MSSYCFLRSLLHTGYRHERRVTVLHARVERDKMATSESTDARVR